MIIDDEDSQPEIGSDETTVKLKEEEAFEKAIKKGTEKANEDILVQLHEDSVSQFAPSDIGRFQCTEHMALITNLMT